MPWTILSFRSPFSLRHFSLVIALAGFREFGHVHAYPECDRSMSRWPNSEESCSSRIPRLVLAVGPPSHCRSWSLLRHLGELPLAVFPQGRPAWLHHPCTYPGRFSLADVRIELWNLKFEQPYSPHSADTAEPVALVALTEERRKTEIPGTGSTLVAQLRYPEKRLTG